MMSPRLEMSRSEKLSNLLPEPSLQEAVAVLTRLVKDRTFLDAHILPLLEEARQAENWYVAHTYEGQDNSYSLQAFVWPPGTRPRFTTTPPGELTAALWDPCWKSVTSALTMAPGLTTPA